MGDLAGGEEFFELEGRGVSEVAGVVRRRGGRGKRTLAGMSRARSGMWRSPITRIRKAILADCLDALEDRR